MKPRLAASISALMAGECAGICKAVSGVLPESQTFNGFGRSCSSSMRKDEIDAALKTDLTKNFEAALEHFQFQRFKSSKGLLFKVHDDDNDFSDLGPPVERAIRQLKLVTEKPNPFLKLDNGRKVSSRKCRRESEQHVKDIMSVLDKPCQSELDNGDVIQSESLESCNRAIRAGGLTVGSSRLPIRPLWDTIVVTIRIEEISKDATFGEIHSICKSVGTPEALAWVRKDAIDALFTVENDTESESILKKLNSTIVGGQCLSASLLHCNSSSALMPENEDVRRKMALQINNYLTELKGQLVKKKSGSANFQVLKVHMEDLQMLHEGIMHLEDLPSIIDTSDN